MTAALLAGCSGVGTGPGDVSDCALPAGQLVDGGSLRDSIPALSNPRLSGPFEPGALYLQQIDRVIGLVVEGQAIAIPHNILWWHEIVNFDFPGMRIAVTYSPFTGSSLVFDRSAAAVDRFAVSDFLFDTNLVMEDSETGSLWPQMSRGALCGSRGGAALTLVPAVETNWASWRGMHRDTRVVSRATGFERLYTLYPYGDYEALDNSELPQSIPALDGRRPPKERVLGVPDGGGGLAFPFLELTEAAAGAGGAWAAHAEVAGEPVVVFWSTFGKSAIALRPEVGGAPLAFEAEGGRISDRETGTRWRADGLAMEGPLAGERLPLVRDAYVSFWFAWALFQPDTRIWTPED